MRKLAHISDLHFGRLNATTLEPLIAALRTVEPHLTIVSVDLTQRARTDEFVAARSFLDRLPSPLLAVPGNHDVPLHNPIARFFSPLGKYRRYVDRQVDPYFADEEIVVQGLNTARSFTWKNGRINGEQLDLVRKRFAAADACTVKIVVTHHPLDLPATVQRGEVVGRAERALPALAACGVDLLLAGHYHVGGSGETSRRYAIDNFAAITVQSGTTTSSRRRDEPNSFNLIYVDRTMIEIEHFRLRDDERAFAAEYRERYHRTAGGWRRGLLETSPSDVVDLDTTEGDGD